MQTNADIETHLTELVAKERQLTHEILILIREAERRRLYLEKGYASAFDWLVRAYGYSHSAAYRRIQASRLLRDVPELAEQLRDGRVNLTTMAQLQATVQRQERLDGQSVAAAEKRSLALKLENKSSEETQRLLAERFPEAMSRGESLRAISATESRLTVVLDRAGVAALERAKDHLSHTRPAASWSEVVKHCVASFVKKVEGTKSKVVSSMENVTPSPAATQRAAAGEKPRGRVGLGLRRTVLGRANYSCEYKDPRTGRLCGSRFQVEVDHILPRALGGSDEASNLRCLCKTHNLAMAERELGAELMSRYWPLK